MDLCNFFSFNLFLFHPRNTPFWAQNLGCYLYSAITVLFLLLLFLQIYMKKKEKKMLILFFFCLWKVPEQTKGVFFFLNCVCELLGKKPETKNRNRHFAKTHLAVFFPGKKPARKTNQIWYWSVKNITKQNKNGRCVQPHFIALSWFKKKKGRRRRRKKKRLDVFWP